MRDITRKEAALLIRRFMKENNIDGADKKELDWSELMQIIEIIDKTKTIETRFNFDPQWYSVTMSGSRGFVEDGSRHVASVELDFTDWKFLAEALAADFLNYYYEFGWKCTDPNSNQYCRKINELVYELREDRIVNPETKETKTYESVIDLREYSSSQIQEALDAFGYKKELQEEFFMHHPELVAECLFELEN